MVQNSINSSSLWGNPYANEFLGKHRPLKGRLRSSRTTKSCVCWKHMQWLTWWLVRLYLEQFVVTYCLEYNFAGWCIECPSTKKRCSSGWDMWWWNKRSRSRSNWHCHHRYDRSKRAVYENYVIITISRCVFQWSTQGWYKSKAVERVTDTLDLINFLRERDPFVQNNALINIAIGMTAESIINVDRAKRIGENILESMVDKTVEEFTFRKADEVVTMSSRLAGIKGSQ